MVSHLRTHSSWKVWSQGDDHGFGHDAVDDAVDRNGSILSEVVTFTLLFEDEADYRGAHAF